jgi:hypothetical protein
VSAPRCAETMMRMRTSGQLHNSHVACCVLPNYLFPMSTSQRHCIVLVFLRYFIAYLSAKLFMGGHGRAFVGSLSVFCLYFES